MSRSGGQGDDVEVWGEEAIELFLEEGVVVAIDFVPPRDEEVVDVVWAEECLFNGRLENLREILFLPEIPDSDDDVSTRFGNSREFGDRLFPEPL